jgi:hypothetical protein
MSTRPPRKKPFRLHQCDQCGEDVRVTIDEDGFFATSCKCGSVRTWRIYGKDLPMTLEMLDPRQLDLFPEEP